MGGSTSNNDQLIMRGPTINNDHVWTTPKTIIMRGPASNNDYVWTTLKQ